MQKKINYQQWLNSSQTNQLGLGVVHSQHFYFHLPHVAVLRGCPQTDDAKLKPNIVLSQSYIKYRQDRQILLQRLRTPRKGEYPYKLLANAVTRSCVTNEQLLKLIFGIYWASIDFVGIGASQVFQSSDNVIVVSSFVTVLSFNWSMDRNNSVKLVEKLMKMLVRQLDIPMKNREKKK